MAKEERITFNIDKEKNFSEWFSEILKRAEIADLRYKVKGFVVFRPWSVLIMEKMYDEFERELQAKGHLPCYFPALIPQKNFELEAEHIKGFAPAVFWVTEHGDEKFEEKLALRPTSETAFYQLYSLWIRSWKDLPLKLYQRANVWRYETKATRPFMRSREFYWIEAHDAFSTRQEAERQVKDDMLITEKIMHKLFGIPFLFFQRPEWDKFAGAVYTYGSDSLMPDGRVIQQPSTHFLGQGFASVFKISFKDKNGKEQHVWQTCYGPAVSRIFASLIAVHGDNSGLILPFCLAPIQVIIIPIFSKKDKAKIMRKAEEISKKLEYGGIKAKVDNSAATPGEKFYFWEMKGIPLRLEIGSKEIKTKQLTLFIRDNKKRKLIKEKDLSSLKKEGEAFDERLKKKADYAFKKSIVNANSIADIKKALEKGKIVRVNFCSILKEGEKCAEVVEKQLLATVRGIRADKKEKPQGKCVICGKKANCVAYIAKSY